MIESTSSIDMDRVRDEAVLDEEMGQWLTSKLNRSPSVAGQPASSAVVIKDDTLRSGANTPGVYATIAQKLRVADALAEAGVTEVEAGYASVADHLDFIRQLKSALPQLRLAAHCDYFGPGWRDRIDRSVEAGADVVNIVGMAGYLMSMGLHPHLMGDAVIERIQEAASHAKTTGAYVAIGTVASTLDEFGAAVGAALSGGADRVYIYDARGWHSPQVMGFLTRYTRRIVGDNIEIAVHCHDDYGMATANTCEAVVAGADVVDVTVIRTGHRCGNASLEQVVTALESIYGVRTGISLSQLSKLAQRVSAEYQFAIAPNAPVVGDHMYTYGGAHIPAVLGGNWFVWENIKAEAVGQRRNIVFGITALHRHSASPVLAQMEQMGIELSEAQVATVFEHLHDLIDSKREATLSEVERIIREVGTST